MPAVILNGVTLNSTELGELYALALAAGTGATSDAAWIKDVIAGLGTNGGHDHKFIKHLIHVANTTGSVDTVIQDIANHSSLPEQQTLLGAVDAGLGLPMPATFNLTLGSNEVVSGENTIGTTTPDVMVQSTGNVTVNALLAPAYAGSSVLTPTLNSGDIINLAGTGNVLNAQFDGGANVVNVDIQGVQTWNIAQENSSGGMITITADVLASGATTGTNNPVTDPILSGLTNLTFSDSSTTGSLNIGTNTEPLYLAPGATSPINFAITVISAVGNGDNGVDVDITASAFTVLGSTITVDAEGVGGFPVDSGGSLVVPYPILGTTGDPDNYNPNWKGYYCDSYSISAGASSGGPTGHPGDPETGAIGFTNWSVYSSAAESVGGLNIIALGGEGSVSATSLTLADDGSNTMLYASFQSDSLGGHDWQNLTTINLTGTSGFVTLTGLEASNQAGFDIGLLADVQGPINIYGGTGNSFYDLTDLTFTGAAGSHIYGGSNTVYDATVSELPGWSEVAFNNNVWTENGAYEGGDTVIPIHNISVGDDASTTQGGSINMWNFPLTPLSQPYALIAEANPSEGTVPFGLPYTYDSTAPLPSDPTLGDYLQEGVIPAGFEVLQLLNPDGSTAVELSNNLDIINGPTNFAINMQDVSDPDAYNVQVVGVESAQNLVLFVDDGCSPKAPEAYDTVTAVTVGSEVFSIPVLTIENYQNVDIVLPSELAKDGNDVGLGTIEFVVAPSDAELTTTVNFYDNVADTGGSPPGSEDNLYLGQTQTYGYEQFGSSDPFGDVTGSTATGTATDAALIGHATVIIDVNLAYPTPPSAIICDDGTGRFEIGATDATTIYAQNTGQTGDGGLIMDLPATYSGAFGAMVGGSGENTFFENVGNENPESNLGICVTGSVHGTNLLQGSSGPISLDYAATLYGDGGINNAYYGTVGDNILTGGPDGDNYFPEGGCTTINLASDSPSTIWFGFYDVGYSGKFETGTGPGNILEQAITDFSSSSTSGEQFVNEYGNDLLTVCNFNFNPTGGTHIIFGTSDWAYSDGGIVNGQQLRGLETWSNVHQLYGTTPTAATYDTLGTAADDNPANAVSPAVNVVLDNIGGGFASEANLQTALTTKGGGDIYFNGGLAGHSTANYLLAYQNSTTHEIDIADIEIVNKSGSTVNDTAESLGTGGSLTVHDLMSIHTTGLVGVANLIGHIDLVSI